MLTRTEISFRVGAHLDPVYSVTILNRERMGVGIELEASVSDTSHFHAKAIDLAKHVIRMTTAAGSGHATSSAALVHIVVELMYRQMRYDPADPWNPASDRLVLSLGHAVPIVYAAYADLTGAVGTSPASRRLLTLDDLHTLRELRSVLDGHPNPAEGFPFFDAATGSLGQGLSVAAGLALGARLDGLDKRIFVIIGDGESREGQIWEAADFLVDHRLNNVCAVFSCNGWGQAGEVSAQQSADALSRKMTAFGWDAMIVDGHDPAELRKSFDRLGKAEKPLAVIARTTKGWGVPSIIGKNYHGKPLTNAELEKALVELEETGRRLGLRAEAHLAAPKPPSGRRSVSKSGVVLPPFQEAARRVGLEKSFAEKKMSTRVAYGVGLVALGDASDSVVALDGDVSNSTFANLFAKHHPNRFFECKIAEQNMISVGAGLSAAGRIPFASSFSKFLARGTDQIDMASISRANLKIVGSHSGVSLAADGPSQMSLADMAYFRSMTRVDVGDGRIGCTIFHPADAVCAYRCCERMANIDGLCYLRTHRPDAPFLYSLDEKFELRGCKQLRTGRDLTLVSSGYMVHVVLEAAAKLEASAVFCNVFDAYTFPLDDHPILEAARCTNNKILTVEDNYLGGLHAELAEAAAAAGSIRVGALCVSRMPKSARTSAEVFTYTGVGVEHIIQRAEEWLRE